MQSSGATITATPLIQVDNLVFEYRDKRALNDVSFRIEEGSVTALVGSNGAGKTTLLRCLAGLEDPLSGTILIDGVNVRESPRAAHLKLGFLQDFFGLYDTLTVRQNVLHAAAIMGVPEARLEEAADRAIAAVSLSGLVTRKGSELSRGQRQRLAIARTIVHRPRLLLLDEPASGLDPDARRELSTLIRSLYADGTTLIVSSHILTELEDYSTQMLAMRDGGIRGPVRLGTAQSAARRLGITVLAPDASLAARLEAMEAVSNVRTDGAKLFFDFAGDAADQHALLRRLIEQGFPLVEFVTAGENLEQLYFAESTP